MHFEKLSFKEIAYYFSVRFGKIILFLRSILENFSRKIKIIEIIYSKNRQKK